MFDRDHLRSLEKGLRILELLAQMGTPQRFETLVQESGLSKTTCFRILKTMTLVGFVARDPETRAFRLGPKAVAVGLAAVGSERVREIAAPYMRELREETRATVNLGILVGMEVVFVERMQSPYIMESTLKVGSRLPAHCSSLGKAILAFLPDEERQALLEKLTFERRTPNTITDRETFAQELEKIRREGFSVNNEELEVGLFAVAAPLLDRNGVAVAAINLSFPLARYSKEEAMTVLCPRIVEVSQKVSRLLGWRGRIEGNSRSQEVCNLKRRKGK